MYLNISPFFEALGVKHVDMKLTYDLYNGALRPVKVIRCGPFPSRLA